MLTRCFILLSLWLSISPAGAGDIELLGSVAGEWRLFVQDAKFPDQFKTHQPSLVINPEFRYQSADGQHDFTFVPFYRLDGQDSRRTHFDIREAYWLTVKDDWEIRVGIDRVFWGVTESRHLVDIINQTDFVEDVDNEDKLGQPMIHAAYQQDWGWLGLYVLPGFRERTFPGKDGRLRFPVTTDGDARYDGNASQSNVDFALRYSQVFGDWDVGAYVFHGVGREPRFELNANGSRLVPTYDIINQIGTDVQYTLDAWLWKFEGIVREGQSDTFGALVAGFEYTLFQIAASNADLGLLFEYLYDGRDDDPAEAPVVAFDDDVFFGARLALNDIQDTELLIGAVIDRSDRSTSMFMEAERRLTDHWNAELEGRFFFNTDEGEVLDAFEKDGFFALRLSYFF